MRWILLWLFLFGFVSVSLAQKNEFFGGFFPEAAITKKLKNDRQIILKVEHQDIFFDQATPTEGAKVRHYRTDLMGFYGLKLNHSKSIALGVFHRIQDGANANRIIQQYALVSRVRSTRLAHRFRTDQTFTKGEDVELRFRYRIAAEFPLSGTTLEPKENYFVASNEPIFSLQSGEFEIENRLVLTLGRLLTAAQKVEVSADYRTDKFIQEGFRTRLWLKVGYFYSF